MLTLTSLPTQAIAIAETTEQMLSLWLYGKSPHTQKAYRRDVHEFMVWLGGAQPQTWTANDIQEFSQALQANGLKQSSINRKILAIKSLLTFLKKIGVTQLNAGAVIPIQRLKNEVAQRILTESQVLELIYRAKPLDRVIIKLLYSTGMRSEELRGLRWTDATPQQDGSILLTVHGKGRKTRYILIRASLWLEVEAAAGRSCDFVFSTKNGKMWDASRLHKLVKRAGQAVGLEGISPHWLRHAHASHALDRGCPLHVLQKTMGHSSISTTERYLHVRPTDSSGLYLAI